MKLAHTKDSSIMASLQYINKDPGILYFYSMNSYMVIRMCGFLLHVGLIYNHLTISPKV